MNLPHTSAAAPAWVDQAGFAQALLDPAQPCPPGLCAWNGSDPAARLAVYRNNVMSSLVDALASSFPVLQQLVGDTFFRAMAALFVRRHPPCSPVLSSYGDQMADFIAGFEPAAGLPWLPDLARLEHARVQACHAADAPPADPQALAAALGRPQALLQARLTLQPSLRLLVADAAVVSLWAAHQLDDDAQRARALAELQIAQAEQALVLRDAQFQVLVLAVDAGTAAFVAAALRGEPLGAAALAASQAQDNTDLSAVLALLLGHGAITRMTLP